MPSQCAAELPARSVSWTLQRSQDQSTALKRSLEIRSGFSSNNYLLSSWATPRVAAHYSQDREAGYQAVFSAARPPGANWPAKRNEDVSYAPAASLHANTQAWLLAYWRRFGSPARRPVKIVLDKTDTTAHSEAVRGRRRADTPGGKSRSGSPQDSPFLLGCSGRGGVD